MNSRRKRNASIRGGRFANVLLLAAAACLAQTGSLSAAVTYIEFIGPTSGTVQWTNTANWSEGNVPDIRGDNGEVAVITNVITADRTIELPADLEISGFEWNYESGATGVDTLKLLGDVTVTGPDDDQCLQVFNGASDRAKMIVDLDGHTFAAPGGRKYSSLAEHLLTITSSSPGGVFTQRQLGDAALIASNVTARVSGGGHVQNLSGLWSLFEDGSTFHLDMVSRLDQFFNVYDMVVGRADGSVNAYGSLRQYGNKDFTVRNDLTLHPGGIGIGWYASGFVLLVGGDFTDNGSGDYGGADGDIIFNGGGNAQHVSMTRTGITDTAFLVGSSSASGYVVLDHALSTQDELGITAASHLDVGVHTATGGTVTVADGAEITVTAAAASGCIVASNTGIGSGDLTLNEFTLHLVDGGGWDDGEDLVLFRFDGTLTGTPTLAADSELGEFYHDGLVVDDSTVRLTHLAISPQGTLFTIR